MMSLPCFHEKNCYPFDFHFQDIVQFCNLKCVTLLFFFFQMSMSANGVAECVFHGAQWRSSVQAILNQLRQRHVPNKLMYRISTLVCPCNAQRFQDTNCDAFTEASYQELQEWFSENVFGKLDHGVTSVVHIFEKMFSDITPHHASRLRLLVIVKYALEGDVFILERAAAMKHLQNDKERKYLFEEAIQLPLKCEYMGCFIGNNGQHIKPICEQYNCEIQIDVPKMRYRYAQDIGVVTTRIKVNSSVDLQKVKDVLIARAEAVAVSRAAHERKVVKYAQVRLKFARIRLARKEERRDKAKGFWVAAEGIKDNNREIFSGKQKHHGDDHRKKKPMGVLEEGSRCINCLAPMDKSVGECCYHPGYIITGNVLHDKRNVYGKYWSCCKKLVENDHSKKNQQTSHEESGCQTGIHNWRPTKNDSTKKTKKGKADKIRD